MNGWMNGWVGEWLDGLGDEGGGSHISDSVPRSCWNEVDGRDWFELDGLDGTGMRDVRDVMGTGDRMNFRSRDCCSRDLNPPLSNYQVAHSSPAQVTRQINSCPQPFSRFYVIIVLDTIWTNRRQRQLRV